MQHHGRTAHGVPRGPQVGRAAVAASVASGAPAPDAATALSTAIEQQPREGIVREVQGFFGLGGVPIYRVRFVVLRKQEENDALRAAATYCAQQCQGNDALKNDPDFTLDAKHVEVLFRGCKQEDSGLPAFPGPQWMRDKLTTDQIGVLLAVSNEVRAKLGPINYDLSQESVDAIVTACADSAATDLPDLVLERFPREVLSSLCVRMACMLREAREDLEAAETAAAAAAVAASPESEGPVDTEEPTT